MVKKVVTTNSPEETIQHGKSFADSLNPGDIVALKGQLSSGKTTFVQGIAQGLGIPESVNSPTFKIVGEFSGKIPLYHIDFYRLNSSKELLTIGLEHYLYGDGVTVIEWADRFPEVLPEKCIHISLQMVEGKEFCRKITIHRKS